MGRWLLTLGGLMMAKDALWKKMFNPLRSRKTRVAMATVVAAFAAEFGLGVSQELILTILGIGVSLILGIAHEDAGRLRSSDVRR
ncbi:MAG: hypothetical protein GXP29_00525 [Planctomycetes bacterium]|nr:hypothetical protein [Planctomycetota bacterium]